jgi:hypothetical protein
MSFTFSSQADQDTHSTLTSLIKSNDGQYKSVKQADFLNKRFTRENLWDSESAMKNFGIQLTADQFMVSTNAYVRWVGYGTKSVRPVTWMFVMDQHGVVAQYKLGYVGDMRGGTSPDPAKTTTVWQRMAEVVALQRPVEPEVQPSEHIGTIGERMTFKGVIVSVAEFERAKFHYYDSGVGYITRVNVNGNDVVYFGTFGLERGAEVEFKATVKEHGEYRGRRQTVVNRPKLMS